jgi:alpha-ketoglutarate-dependent taurine dioxygenase
MMVELPGAVVRPLIRESDTLLLADCTAPGLNLATLARANRHSIEELLRRAGAVLFRGFGILDEHGFTEVAQAMCTPMAYVYRSTPRTHLGNNVYTATEYPANRVIPVHCENTYQRDWPMRLVFMCERAARVGGETPLAHVARTTAELDPRIKELFLRKKLLYVRNYRTGLDLPWQTVFQTDSKREVEGYCEDHGIEWEWVSEDHLRTRQTCEALMEHPDTGELLWVNQAHLFHVSSLPADVRRALTNLYGEQDLPRNALHGDGSPLDDAHLAAVRAAFEKHTVAFPWQAGDVLLVDNMAIAHGRNTFEGERRVLVAMGDAYSARRAAHAGTH